MSEKCGNSYNLRQPNWQPPINDWSQLPSLGSYERFHYSNIVKSEVNEKLCETWAKLRGQDAVKEHMKEVEKETMTSSKYELFSKLIQKWDKNSVEIELNDTWKELSEQYPVIVSQIENENVGSSSIKLFKKLSQKCDATKDTNFDNPLLYKEEILKIWPRLREHIPISNEFSLQLGDDVEKIWEVITRNKDCFQQAKLDLSNLGLEEFPIIITYLTELGELDLSNNQLKEIPKEIQRLQKVRTLNLDNNQFDVIPVHALFIGWLKRVFLNQNPIILNDTLFVQDNFWPSREFYKQLVKPDYFVYERGQVEFCGPESVTAAQFGRYPYL